LSWGAVAGAVVGLQPKLGLALTEAEADSLSDKLLSIFSQRRSAAVVGTSWLRQLDERPEVDALVEGVMDHLDLTPRSLHASDVGSLRQRVRTKVSEDFAAGRTISVDGWVLGRTEVHLCGIAALVPSA
jgi:hypothetical protein